MAWSTSLHWRGRSPAGCRAGPSRGGRSARSARRARPAGGPAGSCAAKRAGLVDVGAVQVEDVLAARFEMSVSSGTRGLHAEGHLVLGDAGLRLRVAELLELAAGSAGRARRASRRRVAGVDAGRDWTGRAPGRPCGAAPRPGACVGRKPRPTAGCRAPGRLPCSTTTAVITTNAGRFWFSLPRP